MKGIKIIFLAFIAISCANSDGSSEFNFGDGSGVNAVTGSSASFQDVNGFLYILADGKLKVIDTRNNPPSLVSTVPINAEAETIYRYGENLLLGTQSGMMIYDISERNNPTLLSTITHQTACDPVIAKDDIAYLTIRGGVTCNQEFPANRLIVLDISDLENPVEIRQIQMTNPRGLTISDNRLFVGEGINGVQQFSLTDPKNPVYEKVYGTISTNDLIALGTHIIITGSNGIQQYTNVNGTLEFISLIE